MNSRSRCSGRVPPNSISATSPIPKSKAAADDADALLLDFYRRHRRLALSCLCYLFAWSMGPLEIYILLTLLHQPATLVTSCWSRRSAC